MCYDKAWVVAWKLHLLGSSRLIIIRRSFPAGVFLKIQKEQVFENFSLACVHLHQKSFEYTVNEEFFPIQCSLADEMSTNKREWLHSFLNFYFLSYDLFIDLLKEIAVSKREQSALLDSNWDSDVCLFLSILVFLLIFVGLFVALLVCGASSK